MYKHVFVYITYNITYVYVCVYALDTHFSHNLCLPAFIFILYTIFIFFPLYIKIYDDDHDGHNINDNIIYNDDVIKIADTIFIYI